MGDTINHAAAFFKPRHRSFALSLRAAAPAGLRSTQQFFLVFQGRGAFTDGLHGAGQVASPALDDLFDHIRHRLGERTAAAQAGEGKGKEEPKGKPFFSWFCSLSQRRFSSVHLHAGAENLSGLQIFIGRELKEGGLELTVVDFPLLGAYAGPAGAAGRGRLLQLDPSVIPAQETTAKLPRPSGLVFFARQADLDIWQAGLARNEEDGLHTNGQTIFLVFRVSRP